jgi:hypothetical protein
MTRATCASILSVAACCLIGCQKPDPYATDLKSILANPSPELQGVAETPNDVNRNLAINFNSNMRQASDDLGRVFLLDRPNLGSPYPIVNTTGNP